MAISDDDDKAPGWDAIDAAADRLYPGIKPYHVGYNPGVHFGSGLQGCSAYAADGHWHYITYGLTELWDKDEGTDPAVSGWGFELTMRVIRQSGDGEPPTWPFNLLGQVAKFVRNQDVLVEEGHRMDTRNSITGSPDSRLTVLAFTADPQLPAIATPNGRVFFLQLVGVTADELAQMKQSSTTEILRELSAGNPLLITYPGR